MSQWFFSGETSKTVSFRRAAEFWDRSGGMGGIFRLRSGRIPAVFRRRSGAKWLIFRRSGIFGEECVVSPDCVLVARMVGWNGRFHASQGFEGNEGHEERIGSPVAIKISKSPVRNSCVLFSAGKWKSVLGGLLLSRSAFKEYNRLF